MAGPTTPLGKLAVGAVGLVAGVAALWPRGRGEAPAASATASPQGSGGSGQRSAAAASPSCEAPREHDCTFYTACIESNVPCGQSGYALGFGDKYCNRFKAAPLSPAGVTWASSVMLCLEQSLVPYARPDKKSASCEEISRAAFDSHPDCYTRAGASICFLSAPDIETVFDTIRADELFAPRTRPQIQAVMEACIQQFAEPGPYAPAPEGPDGGLDLGERRACWIHLRDKYQGPP